MKCEACRAVYLFYTTSLMNSLIQEYECLIPFIIRHIVCFEIPFLAIKSSDFVIFFYYVGTIFVDVIS